MSGSGGKEKERAEVHLKRSKRAYEPQLMITDHVIFYTRIARLDRRTASGGLEPPLLLLQRIELYTEH